MPDAAPSHAIIDLPLTPTEALAAWPEDRPLLMLHSARPHPRWARWSILASPRVTYRFDGRSRWIGKAPPALAAVRFSHDPLADLDRIVAATRRPDRRRADAPPFAGGWIGYLSYDLGRVIEPRAGRDPGPRDDRGWPLIEMAWCPAALVHDHRTGWWTSIGGAALEASGVRPAPPPARLGPLHAPGPAAAHLDAVARTLEYIAAGDIYQASITQRLTAELAGPTRAFCRAAIERSGAWYAAYLELPGGRRLGSLSPELFLQVDALDRRIVTRPIKGTRPSRVAARELLHSAKDAAELHMIVDLLRNDLGRVCRLGTVEVIDPRSIETHPTVHHGVGEVTGRLREDVGVGELLAATFPGGSVTGVPKIRAMQIIDELEPVRRGPYCGAIGFISDAGDLRLSIAIRTMLFTPEGANDGPGRVDYGVGGGIVADSDPDAEHRESLDKAAVLGVPVMIGNVGAGAGSVAGIDAAERGIGAR